MLKVENFWSEEENANLFLKNEGFLKPNEPNEEAFIQSSNWLSTVRKKTASTKIDYELKPVNEDIRRVIDRDVERTFLKPSARVPLTRGLNQLAAEFGDYHQGMSYALALLLLTYSEEEALEVCRRINYAYLTRHWRAVSVGNATDALIFIELVSKSLPDVKKKLDDVVVLAETFCQKWFAGLCLHVANFEAEYKIFTGWCTSHRQVS